MRGCTSTAVCYACRGACHCIVFPLLHCLSECRTFSLMQFILKASHILSGLSTSLSPYRFITRLLIYPHEVRCNLPSCNWLAHAVLLLVLASTPLP